MRIVRYGLQFLDSISPPPHHHHFQQATMSEKKKWWKNIRTSSKKVQQDMWTGWRVNKWKTGRKVISSFSPPLFPETDSFWSSSGSHLPTLNWKEITPDDPILTSLLYDNSSDADEPQAGSSCPWFLSLSLSLSHFLLSDLNYHLSLSHLKDRQTGIPGLNKVHIKHWLQTWFYWMMGINNMMVVIILIVIIILPKRFMTRNTWLPYLNRQN